jgi:hypothetical protein
MAWKLCLIGGGVAQKILEFYMPKFPKVSVFNPEAMGVRRWALQSHPLSPNRTRKMQMWSKLTKLGPMFAVAVAMAMVVGP